MTKFHRLPLLIVAGLAIAAGCNRTEYITNNTSEPDGFGSQFQETLATIVYAELSYKRFVYSPMTSLDHNYDGDPNFLSSLESMIAVDLVYPEIDNLEKKVRDGVEKYPRHQLKSYLDDHMDMAAEVLAPMRAVFREQNKKWAIEASGNSIVAVHVRRTNPHDDQLPETDLIGRYIDDEYYLGAMEFIKRQLKDKGKKPPVFYIYSQGKVEDFKVYQTKEGAILKINAPLVETFSQMVLADCLIMAPSSLSQAAALLSEGTVVYKPYWHKPASNWLIVGDNN